MSELGLYLLCRQIHIGFGMLTTVTVLVMCGLLVDLLLVARDGRAVKR